MKVEDKKKIKLIGIMGILLIITIFISLVLGKYWVSPIDAFKAILNKTNLFSFDYDKNIDAVLFNIRFPRIILGLLIGGGLSCAGATYQGIFQNPIISPDILGASWGAAFGAALGLILLFGHVMVSIIAFLIGIFAVFLVCIVGQRCKSNRKMSFVLGGIMVGSIFSAGVSYIKLVADPSNTLPVITYWLMGSLASARKVDVLIALPPIIIGIIPIFLMRWKLNILTLGDDEIKSMGINARQTRLIFIVCATLITSASVSVSGMIGWVGLIIPHFARIILGHDYRYVIPASLILGSGFLVLIDNVARLVSTIEIPIGILTAVVGAPLFLYLLTQEEKICRR